MPKELTSKAMQQAFPFQIRNMNEDGMEGIIEGYASVFNVEDSYGTVFRKGAFKESIDSKTAAGVKFLYQHEWREVIGIVQTLMEDEVGLFIRDKVLLGVQKGREVFELIKAGAIDAFSVGFVTQESEYNESEDVIDIKKADLWEVSPVTFPSNKLAMVTDVRNQDFVKDTELEQPEETPDWLLEMESRLDALTHSDRGFSQDTEKLVSVELDNLIKKVGG